MLDSFKGSGNYLFFIASLIQFVKNEEKNHILSKFSVESRHQLLYSKINYLTISFTNSSEFAGNFLVTFYILNTWIEPKAVCNFINTVIDLIR